MTDSITDWLKDKGTFALKISRGGEGWMKQESIYLFQAVGLWSWSDVLCPKSSFSIMLTLFLFFRLGCPLAPLIAARIAVGPATEPQLQLNWAKRKGMFLQLRYQSIEDQPRHFFKSNCRRSKHLRPMRKARTKISLYFKNRSLTNSL